jgi:Zn-dependent peptidase ImmA (M78 family)/transcriptional regulator with XRE-family HTH domain
MNPFPLRLQSARHRAGMSLRDLSMAMGSRVSHTALNRYEKGIMKPDGNMLVELSKVLNVGTDYFFREPTLEITEIEFRKKAKLTQRELKAIKLTVKDQVERYLELEGYLDAQVAWSNPLSVKRISSPDDIELAVALLQDEWDLGTNALPNITLMLEERGIKVVEIEANQAFDGFSGWGNSSIPIIVVNRTLTLERKRFTLLHELAHLVLEFDKRLELRQRESLCHRFAGAMLIPEGVALRTLGPMRASLTMPELVALKEQNGISIQAIMARAKDLHIIGGETYVRFRKRVNTDPKLKLEEGYGAYQGSESPQRFNQLLCRAASERIVSMSKAASLAGMKFAQFRAEFAVV